MNADVRTSGLSSDGISDAINKIMEHPELISMVASALSGSSVEKSNKESEPTPAEQTEEDVGKSAESGISGIDPSMLASVMPMISKLSTLNSSKDKSGLSSKHEQLLCALKLYVSPQRCQAIDYILKFSQMSGLLQGLK